MNWCESGEGNECGCCSPCGVCVELKFLRLVQRIVMKVIVEDDQNEFLGNRVVCDCGTKNRIGNGTEIRRGQVRITNGMRKSVAVY